MGYSPSASYNKVDKVDIWEEVHKEREINCLCSIVLKIEWNQIPASLVINLEKTPAKFVVGCNKTPASEESKCFNFWMKW